MLILKYMWSPIFLRGLPEEKEKSVKGQLHGDKWKQLWWWARCSVSVQLCLTLWPHGLQHARLSCPSRTPRTCSNSCPSSLWSHPTISPSVVPFSPCLQSSPASGSSLIKSTLCIRSPEYWSFSISISPSNESRASLVAQRLKHLSPMRETWVQSLGQEDPLERNGNPLQYSCLENPMDGEAW